jgi:hypothetical protein
MYAESLLITAIYYEAKKRDSTYWLRVLWLATTAAAEAGTLKFGEIWDASYPTENPICTSSILCLHEGRHKNNCPLNRKYSEKCPPENHFSCRKVHQGTH